VSISNDHRLRSCITGNCYVQFWIGGGESDLSADHTYNETLSGVPQGGIVSPILSNILLDKLDKFVENVLIPQYTRGTRRKANPEYDKLMRLSGQLRRQGNVEKAEEARSKAQGLPSSMTDDPDFRRLNYVRYADDVRPVTQDEILRAEKGGSEEDDLRVSALT
jgi:retron-type reverse transcriptase